MSKRWLQYSTIQLLVTINNLGVDENGYWDKNLGNNAAQYGHNVARCRSGAFASSAMAACDAMQQPWEIKQKHYDTHTLHWQAGLYAHNVKWVHKWRAKTPLVGTGIKMDRKWCD